MTVAHIRRLLAVATLSVLALTACAVPGQEGAPGVAAIYHGATITNEQVESVYQAWVVDTEARDTANRRQVLTIELLRPQLLEAAAELGYEVKREDAEEYARQWLRFHGLGGEPSEEMIDATHGIFALALIAFSQPDYSVLTEIAEDVEANAVLSPRSGVFSAQTFLASVEGARRAALGQELGAFSYIEFQHVIGLVETDRPWIVGE